MADTDSPPDQRAHSRRPQLSSLTGMRFIAALMVFLYHSTLTEPNITAFRGNAAQALADTFSNVGWIGVSFFFILSGFVLTWSARSGDTPTRFWRRRVAKIYPNHVVTFTLAMILFAAATTSPGTAVLNLFLLQSWVPRLSVFNSVNLPSWSLCCEALFYLLFPSLMFLACRIRPNRLWAWVIGICGYAVLLPALAYLLPSGPPAMGSSIPVTTLQYWVVYVFPLARVPEFVLGILMARIVMSGRWVEFRLAPAAGLMAAAIIAASFVPWLYGLYAVTILPAALLIAAAAVADTRATTSLFRNRVLVRLGELSFAFYMVHGVVILECRKIIGYTRTYPIPVAIAATAFIFAVALAAAWLLHECVEKPFVLRFGRETMRPLITRPLRGATPTVDPAPGPLAVDPGLSPVAAVPADGTQNGSRPAGDDRASWRIT